MQHGEQIRWAESGCQRRDGVHEPWLVRGRNRRGPIPCGADDDLGTFRFDGPLGAEKHHPRAFGAMPRVLGRYVRELKLFGVEEAVRKMTSLPARRMRLFDRGLLRPGMAADITVFDPDRIRDVATFEDPNRYSEGVSYVLVNGRVILDDGKMTAERPGRVLTLGR